MGQTERLKLKIGQHFLSSNREYLLLEFFDDFFDDFVIMSLIILAIALVLSIFFHCETKLSEKNSNTELSSPH